jgi:hypothetical protein
MPRSYYDDNFGFYDIEDQDDLDFYLENQKNSNIKKCKGCGRAVKLLPHYVYCTKCADIIERGGELPEFD